MTEGVGRQPGGPAGVFQPALHHLADIVDVHPALGELPGLGVAQTCRTVGGMLQQIIRDGFQVVGSVFGPAKLH